MTEIFDLFIFILMLTSVVGLIVGYTAWKRREAQGAKPLGILMVSLSLWSFFQILVFLVPGFEAKQIFANLRYLGIQTAPLAYFALAWDYKYRTRSLKLKQYIKIAIFPVLTMHALWNNEVHHRFYTEVFMEDGLLIMNNGPLFWINMIYLYFFVLAGIYLFIRSYQGSQSRHRQQALIIMLAAFIPIISNVVYNFGLLPFENIDITPVSFLLSGLLFSYALFHYRLLDVVPIARDLLIEEMEDLIIVLDNSHRVLDMNLAARQFIIKNDADKPHYIGTEIFTLASAWTQLTEAIKDSGISYSRVSYKTDPKPITFDLNKSEIVDKRGRRIGEVIVLRNITSLEEALEEAREARMQAENASRSKGYFLANMSHEIRTPMNAIIGIAEMMDSEDLSREDQKRYNQTIIKSAESLLTILNDVLDLSKVESGKMELEKGSVDLKQIIEDVVEVFKISTANRSVMIKSNIDHKLPPYLRGDAVRIRQILMNLVGNSIKFTKEGIIAIHAKPIERRGLVSLIEISVKDTGLGIPEDKLGAIFESFKQADSSTTRKYGGTGLGLSIVKSLVELMDGSIHVESELGHGSTFTIVLPLEDAAKPEMAAEQTDQPDYGILADISILVAEDNRINREVISLHLKKLGCCFDMVENGRLAVEMFGRKRYDVILMDVQMPEMDGLRAAEAIRKMEADTDSRTPIIALTAGSMKEDIEKCLLSGMDAHLSKPFKAEGLKKELLSILAGSI